MSRAPRFSHDLPTIQVAVEGARLGAAELAQDHERQQSIKLPAELYSPVLAQRTTGPGINVVPANCTKSVKMARRACEFVGLRGGVRVILDTHLSGRGLSSSSANLRGTARAIFKLAGRDPDETWISEACSCIEPTDPPFEDGLVRLWDFHRATACSVPYAVPAMNYVAILPDTTLATDDVEQNRPRYSPSQRRDVRRALDGVLSALRDGDAVALAEASSLSLEVNDNFYRKPELDLLRELKRADEVLGYAGAHSGTNLGVLSQLGEITPLISRLSRELGTGYTLIGWSTRGRGGGVSGAGVVVDRT